MFSDEILNNGNLLDTEIILKKFIRMLNKSILSCIICFLEKFVNPESPTSGKGFRPSAEFLQATVDALVKSRIFRLRVIRGAIFLDAEWQKLGASASNIYLLNAPKKIAFSPEIHNLTQNRLFTSASTVVLLKSYFLCKIHRIILTGD